jgi:quinol monooxygenase YgiN
MPKVALLSRCKAKAGKAEELIAAFRPVFEQVEKEPGTLGHRWSIGARTAPQQ